MKLTRLFAAVALTFVGFFGFVAPASAGSDKTEVCISVKSGYKNWFRLHAYSYVNGDECPDIDSGKIRITSTRPGYRCGKANINTKIVWVNSNRIGDQFASDMRDGVMYVDPNPGAYPCRGADCKK